MTKEMTRAKEPTYPPPPPAALAPVLDRNIEALRARRAGEKKQASWEERLADAITRFAGSMLFVYIHLTVFGFWLVANLKWIPFVPAWDESFVILAMVASVEAIFLSTFVLISQNRMAAAAENRAELDLQISLLAEHEVTKLASVISAIACKLELGEKTEGELSDAKRDIAPEAVLDAIENKFISRPNRPSS